MFTSVSTSYVYLEFSRDNYSQLVALTTNGEVRSFLLKGRVAELPPERDLEAQGFFDAEKTVPLKRPLELLPFFEIGNQHFTSVDLPMNDQQAAVEYRVSCFAMHPHMSFTGFQHQVMVGSQNGTMMKWNANVGPNFKHETRHRLYGQIFGESMVAQDIPFPGNKLALISGQEPRGADAQFLVNTQRPYQMRLSDNGQATHMNREFFGGHKLPIIFICFVENSPATIVTVDSNGHVFTWLYTADHVTSK